MLKSPTLSITGSQKYLSWPCAYLHRIQWNCMSVDFVLQGIIVLLATSMTVELSHWIGDWGCGHPIYTSVCRSGTISLAQMYRPASSDSAAEDMTHLIIWEMVRTGPLYLGTGTSSDNIM